MREWHPHSEEKISIFEDYIRAFARATQRAPNRVYIDAFAGDTVNILKTTGQKFPGSAEIALAVEPSFTHVELFERKPSRIKALNGLADAHPEVHVHPGDCNVEIPKALATLPNKAPTFAFLDPDGLQVQWRTVRALADHKRAWAEQPRAGGKPGTKVELWILFSTSAMGRLLGKHQAQSEARGFPERVARLYGGTGPWERVWQARREEEIASGEANLAYLRLYMDRLAELGYKHLLARPIHNTRGEFYVMVFATDDSTGSKLMDWAQEKKRVVRRAPTLFDLAEDRPQYEDIHTGWHDEIPFELPPWEDLEL
jgi:three-Cys-motif partner protein